ncbi:MAG: heavy metal-associated domain-containing protein [Cyclobacteriaceae bacterium]
MKTEIKVDNLKCHGCANTITSALQKMEGVDAAAVDVEKSSVLIEHQADFNRELFVDKLAKLGYPEEGTTTAMQRAKSYVSCAIGRI